jgi:hypothetical protein
LKKVVPVVPSWLQSVVVLQKQGVQKVHEALQ